MSSFSDYASFNDKCSEPEESPGKSYYTSNYTSDRPPHLNGDNFSSTQPGGSTFQPRRPPSVHLSGQHVTTDTETDYDAQHYPSSGSANTNSTVKGADPFAQRPDLDYLVNRDYHDSTAPLLTAQAVAALDHSIETQWYNGDIRSWMRAGYNITADATNNGSTGYLQMSNGSMSHSSVATNRSWIMVTTAHDPQAENINGVGGWQADMAADPNTMARNIPDEDTRDH
ncbi:hypothetical protein F4820DRAFT_413355 [Hypoxylon rubiginosum]|uniref:Uncharacterized protein n=1 Tax=Hypoxylon rubiginosum TaxID=110542 RepID=A0ACB9Z8N1_9PEZI|nr:hypothetical protein F4820DRAFT_413355 [Hypoxylon rubiginosum]